MSALPQEISTLTPEILDDIAFRVLRAAKVDCKSYDIHGCLSINDLATIAITTAVIGELGDMVDLTPTDYAELWHQYVSTFALWMPEVVR